jgi:uncharacterized protein YcbX
VSVEIGRIESLFRYPVKSMAGEELDAAELGPHGIDGDRRFALRRTNVQTGFPWLTASKLPELLLFTPVRLDNSQSVLPTHVRTPEGIEFPVLSHALADEIGFRRGEPVEMIQVDEGIFDDSTISVIASSTVDEIGTLTGQTSDVRRFRPNVLVRLTRPLPFQEVEWIGRTLSFGDGDDAPSISVTTEDVRCSMVNLDPGSAASAPEFLKTIARVNRNCAGIYGAVTRPGRLAVGQAVRLHR